jgi:hypothetical protein
MRASPIEIVRTSPSPSCGAIRRAYAPPSSENQATLAPSGDHTGARSAASELRVRLRALPFSVGTVKISPLASMRARTPVAESDTFRAEALTSIQRGWAHG